MATTNTALSVLLKITGAISGGQIAFTDMTGVVQDAMGKQAAAVIKNNQALLGFAATATGVVASMAAMAVHTATVSREIDQMSQKTGIAGKELSTLTLAAQDVGLESDRFEKRLTKINKDIDGAANGNKQLQGAFKRLGIDVKDANGVILPTEDILKKIADRFATMPDGAAKT